MSNSTDLLYHSEICHVVIHQERLCKPAWRPICLPNDITLKGQQFQRSMVCKDKQSLYKTLGCVSVPRQLEKVRGNADGGAT